MSRQFFSLCAFGFIACASTLAAAQPFLRFDQVPVISTSSPETFAELFSGGHCRTVRALCFGDSQETCPGGQGDIYMPRLNYELWRRYGNAPESAFFGPDANTGSGLPYAEWLVRNTITTPGPAPTRLAPSQLPPNSFAVASSTTSGTNILNQLYGAIYSLEPNAVGVNPGAQISGHPPFLDTDKGVYLDVLVASNTSSGGVSARYTPRSTSTPTYFPPNWTVLPSSPPFERPTLTFETVRFGPLVLDGAPYLQVEIAGSVDAKLTDIIGARFIGVADDRGWSVTSFSRGGYHSYDLTGFHGNSWEAIAAHEPDVVFLSYGANDFADGVSPAHFRTLLLSIITLLRDHSRPDLPIILFAEADRTMPPQHEDSFDTLAGVLHSIAQDTPNVCAVNGRRMTDALGWSRTGDLSPFLSDSVHYTPAGARLKAQLEIDALYTAFGRECPADLDDSSGLGNPDCSVTFEDLLYFLAVFDEGTLAADLDDDGDPSSSNPDEAVDINDLLFFLARFERGC